MISSSRAAFRALLVVVAVVLFVLGILIDQGVLDGSVNAVALAGLGCLSGSFFPW
jgi:hypothetical protein